MEQTALARFRHILLGTSPTSPSLTESGAPAHPPSIQIGGYGQEIPAGRYRTTGKARKTGKQGRPPKENAEEVTRRTGWSGRQESNLSHRPGRPKSAVELLPPI